MLPTIDHISNLVERQFPSFYREDGENFIAFVKAYYEWLEQTSNSNKKGRNLFSTRDIDLTAEAFLDNFQKKYMYAIPKQIAGDKRFLQKHILDIYRSKGSIEGLNLFFRLLYNEDPIVYVPAKDILKPSDGKWVENRYLEVTHTPYNGDFKDMLITGGTSGATAFVESYNRLFTEKGVINIFIITNIQGTFLRNERVSTSDLSFTLAPKILGSPTSVTVQGTVTDNEIGDILLPQSGNGSGKDLKTIVQTVREAGSSNGTIDFVIVSGGSGYTTNPTISITTGSNTSGTGATFSGVILSNTSNFVASNTFLNYAPYYANTKSFNANTGVANTSDFITIASNPFANNDRVLYYTSAGNTALSGLTNNTSYWVVSANSSGLKLSTTRGGANINITSGVSETGHFLYKDAVIRFDGNTSVSNTNEFIAIANNRFANGDYVKYLVETGNTAVSGLSNNTNYFIVAANSSGVKLATGNSTTFNTSPINLTSGVTEFGHTLLAYQVANLSLNLVSWGAYMNTTNLASIVNSGIASYNVTIGTITGLVGVNPGDGYNGYVNISVVDNLITGYGLADSNGAIQGNNAVITGNVELGSGLVSTLKIKNSGFGYHTEFEEVELYNDSQSNTSQTTDITINLGAVGIQEGYWDGTRSFLDSDKYIQDSFFYQEYSYEIKFTKPLNKYIDILKQLVHPTGNEVFGKTFIYKTDNSHEVTIENNITIYRILGAALAPADPGEDPFRLNVSRLT